MSARMAQRLRNQSTGVSCRPHSYYLNPTSYRHHEDLLFRHPRRYRTLCGGLPSWYAGSGHSRPITRSTIRGVRKVDRGSTSWCKRCPSYIWAGQHVQRQCTIRQCIVWQWSRMGRTLGQRSSRALPRL